MWRWYLCVHVYNILVTRSTYIHINYYSKLLLTHLKEHSYSCAASEDSKTKSFEAEMWKVTGQESMSWNANLGLAFWGSKGPKTRAKVPFQSCASKISCFLNWICTQVSSFISKLKTVKYVYWLAVFKILWKICSYFMNYNGFKFTDHMLRNINTV